MKSVLIKFLFLMLLKIKMDNSNLIPKHILENLQQTDSDFIKIIENYYLQIKNVNKINQQLKSEVNKLNEIKYLLQKNCNHVWEMDDPQYQTPTSWTCKICDGYK